MKPSIWLLAFLLVGLLPVQNALAQSAETPEADRAYKALEPRVRSVVETFLRTDCEIGEVGESLKAVLEVAATARPYLTAVSREGAPSPVREEFERGLEQTWRARQEFLKTPDALELGPRSFEMMRAISRDQYLKDQRQAIRAKYRERAMLALKAMSNM